MVQVYSSPNCTKCKILKGLLDKAQIKYEEKNASENIGVLREAGFMSLPVMTTEDGKFLGFDNAVKYIYQIGDNDNGKED